MKRSYRIIPIYTGDVSGVCSALYELGGMVVMHDPSGCNSTYNTHDEIRWYDEDSSIFLSGLTEIDAIMGNDKKLIEDVLCAAEEVHPSFIALAGSPIPFLNGTDMPAIAGIIEKKTGIPCFSVPTNGMHDYIYGGGLALAALAKKMTADAAQKDRIEIIPGTVNLLGVTPLDFGSYEHVDIMRKNLEKTGWKILSCWAMGDKTDTLKNAGRAEVNLVASSLGLELARVLEKVYGTPYVVGRPVQGYENRISEALRKKETCPYITDRMKRNKGSAAEKCEEIVLIGEPVAMGSLAAMLELKHGMKAKVFCPMEMTDGLLSPFDVTVRGEEELEEQLKTARRIAADPLYRPICPKEAEFFELPHIAFSGRIFLKQMKPL